MLTYHFAIYSKCEMLLLPEISQIGMQNTDNKILSPISFVGRKGEGYVNTLMR